MFKRGSLLLVVAFVLAGSDAHAQAPGDKGSIRLRPSEKDAPWTSSRMQQAEPMPLLQLDPEALDAFKEQSGAQIPSDAEPQEQSGAAEVPPEQRQGNPGQYPLAWAGRLFFKHANGRDAWCSAQFVSPTVVLTAAHCVQDRQTKAYHRNWKFLLQYNRGKAKQRYDIDCVANHTNWVTEVDPVWAATWDYAMLRIRGRSALGHFGWKSSWDGYNRAVVIGYPSAIGHGEIIQEESALITRILSNQTAPQTGLVEVQLGDPRFHNGASGGAWVGDFKHSLQGDYNHVLTVYSFQRKNLPEYAYGPYWDANFQDLLKYAEKGCR